MGIDGTLPADMCAEIEGCDRRGAEPHPPAAIVETASPGWWTTRVKFDLEACGLIERTNHLGRQRVRRTG